MLRHFETLLMWSKIIFTGAALDDTYWQTPHLHFVLAFEICVKFVVFSRPPSWKCQFPPGVTCAYVISHEPCCALFCSRQDGGKDIDSRGRRKTYLCPFSLRFSPIFSLFLLSLHLPRNEYDFYSKTGVIIAWSGAKSMIVAVVNFLTAQPVFLIHGLILVTF